MSKWTATERVYKAKKKAQHRALVLEAKSRPCVDCGGAFHYSAMDFDHVPGRGKKRGLVSLLVTQGIGTAALLAEFAKCDVVCANCHRIRTFKRNQP